MVFIFSIFASLTFSDSWVNLYDLGQDPGIPSYNKIVSVGDGIVISGVTPAELANITFWLAKIDYEGNIVWKKDFVGPYPDQPDFWVTSMAALNDGSVVVSGSYFNSGYSEVASVMKVSSSGELLWQRTYGESVTSYPFKIDSLGQMSNGNILLTGHGILGEWILQMWIAELSATTGTIVSQRLLSPTPNERGGIVSLAIQNNHVLIGGATCEWFEGNAYCTNYKAWLAKYSNAGTLVWEKRITVPNYTNPIVFFIKQNSTD
ncbi:hypothetical protein L0244_01120, partial [bacterium]|nr:hypothetical protein [bacterium]